MHKNIPGETGKAKASVFDTCNVSDVGALTSAPMLLSSDAGTLPILPTLLSSDVSIGTFNELDDGFNVSMLAIPAFDLFGEGKCDNVEKRNSWFQTQDSALFNEQASGCCQSCDRMAPFANDSHATCWPTKCEQSNEDLSLGFNFDIDSLLGDLTLEKQSPLDHFDFSFLDTDVSARFEVSLSVSCGLSFFCVEAHIVTFFVCNCRANTVLFHVCVMGIDVGTLKTTACLFHVTNICRRRWNCLDFCM